MLEKQTDWRKYENYTTRILNDERVQKYLENYFHLSNPKIKPKKKLLGKKTGTKWEVDGYGYDTDNNLVLIECKHYSSDKVEQNIIAAFAYIIQDIEAKHGIVVTTLGLQSGAIKVAKAENISLIKLDYNSTNENFVVRLPLLNEPNEENPANTVAVFTDQFSGFSVSTGIVKVTRYPVPTTEQVEKAKEKLQQRTNRTDLSDAEVIEEVAKM